MKKFLIVVLLAVVSMAGFVGCYWNESVSSSQVAAKMDGGRIMDVVGPGVHSDWRQFASLEQISCDTITVEVDDPSVATEETQVVGVKVTIQLKRRCDTNSVRELLTNWAAVAQNDEALTKVIQAVASQGIKVGTRSFSMEELLNDRNGLSSTITDTLNKNLKMPIEIVSVVVNDVSPSDSYLKILQEKADYTARTSAELQRQALIKQQSANAQLEQQQSVAIAKDQLLAEQAKTQVEVEIASREGKKIAAQYDVYKTNQAAYDLRRMELMAKILGDKATVYFLQPGQLVNLFMSGANPTVVPTVVAPTTP